jgi:outer membrane protein assembly factor BamB
MKERDEIVPLIWEGPADSIEPKSVTLPAGRSCQSPLKVKSPWWIKFVWKTNQELSLVPVAVGKYQGAVRIRLPGEQDLIIPVRACVPINVWSFFDGVFTGLLAGISGLVLFLALSVSLALVVYILMLVPFRLAPLLIPLLQLTAFVFITNRKHTFTSLGLTFVVCGCLRTVLLEKAPVPFSPVFFTFIGLATGAIWGSLYRSKRLVVGLGLLGGGYALLCSFVLPAGLAEAADPGSIGGGGLFILTYASFPAGLAIMAGLCGRINAGKTRPWLRCVAASTCLGVLMLLVLRGSYAFYSVQRKPFLTRSFVPEFAAERGPAQPGGQIWSKVLYSSLYSPPTVTSLGLYVQAGKSFFFPPEFPAKAGVIMGIKGLAAPVCPLPDGTVVSLAKTSLLRLGGANVVWQTQITNPKFQAGSRPVASADRIYLNSGNKLLAFGIDGKPIWEFEHPEATCSLGTPGIGPKGTLFLCSSTGELLSLSPSGTLIWKVPAAESSSSSPLMTKQMRVVIDAPKPEHLTWTSGVLLGWLESKQKTQRMAGFDIDGQPVFNLAFAGQSFGGDDENVYVYTREKLDRLSSEGVLLPVYNSSSKDGLTALPLVTKSGTVYLGDGNRCVVLDENGKNVLEFVVKFLARDAIQYVRAGEDGKIYCANHNEVSCYRGPPQVLGREPRAEVGH